MKDINSDGKNWYILQAYSGREFRVVDSIKEYIRNEKVDDKFGEIIVPTEEIVEMRRGKRRKTDRKIFPGYIFIQMEMTDDTWQLIRHVPGVVNFVGESGKKPVPMTEKEINKVLKEIEESENAPKPKVIFEPGEMIRVVDGPFNDFNGAVEEVNYEKNRLKVSVLVFGRSTPVELDFTQVQKM